MGESPYDLEETKWYCQTPRRGRCRHGTASCRTSHSKPENRKPEPSKPTGEGKRAEEGVKSGKRGATSSNGEEKRECMSLSFDFLPGEKRRRKKSDPLREKMMERLHSEKDQFQDFAKKTLSRNWRDRVQQFSKRKPNRLNVYGMTFRMRHRLPLPSKSPFTSSFSLDFASFPCQKQIG
jgi:hypothetical protein